MTRPVHLLPRGAEVEDIVSVVAIAVVTRARWNQPPRTPAITESVALAD